MKFDFYFSEPARSLPSAETNGSGNLLIDDVRWDISDEKIGPHVLGIHLRDIHHRPEGAASKVKELPPLHLSEPTPSKQLELSSDISSSAFSDDNKPIKLIRSKPQFAP